MNIEGVEFNVDCFTVIQELQAQLHMNNVPLLNKVIDTHKNVQVCCPYHKGGQERKPSAGFKKSDGTFHCFTCGEVHTLPEVITHCFGHDDDILAKFGWTWLYKNFATIAVEDRKDVSLDFERTNDSRINNDNTTYIGEEELDKYRYYHPYWGKRGITDEHIIELFDLGYDIDTACVTMPVRDRDGKTVFVARRSVKFKFFNYPRDVQKPLYGLYELKCSYPDSYERGIEQVFICESMIDALLLWQAGHIAFALNGTFSYSQIDELKKLPIRKYILCTDNDEAGEKARAVLRKSLSNKLLTEIVFPSNRKDVGECTQDEILHILDWEKY